MQIGRAPAGQKVAYEVLDKLAYVDPELGKVIEYRVRKYFVPDKPREPRVKKPTMRTTCSWCGYAAKILCLEEHKAMCRTCCEVRVKRASKEEQERRHRTARAARSMYTSDHLPAWAKT